MQFYIHVLCKLFMYITCISCKKKEKKNQNGCVSLSERFIEFVYVCVLDVMNVIYRTVPYTLCTILYCVNIL